MAAVGRIRSALAGRSLARDGLALGGIAFVVVVYVSCFLHAKPADIGADFAVCQREAQAWLGGAPMYPAFELAGPYKVATFGLILYPPITIALFAPTLLLPTPLWWLIPGAVTTAIICRLRPGGIWLLAMAWCLLLRPSMDLIVAGNPDIWLVAALAVAVHWRPAAAFVLLKPSVFPLALIGIRSRGWWAVVGVFAVVSLVLLPQTLNWLAVIRNSQGGYRPGGLIYSLQDVPLLAVPLLAWAGSPSRGLAHVLRNQSIETLFHARVWVWPYRNTTRATAVAEEAAAIGANQANPSKLNDPV